MRTKDELSAWRRIYVGVSEMAGRVKEEIGLAWLDKPMPSRLEPMRLLQGLTNIRLSAVFDFETAEHPVTDGWFEDVESLLNIFV